MALKDNLVAYWKLDESSGNAADSVASFTLTNNNTVTYSAGKINNGADFENTSSQSFTSTSSLGINGGAMSISTWVKMESAPASSEDTRMNFVMIQDDTSDVSYILMYRYTGGALNISVNRLKNNIADSWLNYATTLTVGTWYHIVLTYDTTNTRVYLNDSLVIGPSAQSGSGSGTTADGIALGRSIQGARTDLLDGMLDECGVWSRALSSTEVTELYNSGNGLQYPFGVATSAPKHTLLMMGV